MEFVLFIFYFVYRANFIEGKNELFSQPDGSLDWDVQSMGTEFFYSSFFYKYQRCEINGQEVYARFAKENSRGLS